MEEAIHLKIHLSLTFQFVLPTCELKKEKCSKPYTPPCYYQPRLDHKTVYETETGFASHTVFENHRKSLIQQCERSELRLHFGLKLVKNAKSQKFK